MIFYCEFNRRKVKIRREFLKVITSVKFLPNKNDHMFQAVIPKVISNHNCGS